MAQVSELPLSELSNLTMDQIDAITPEEYSKLSKLQIATLPILPLGLRISIALTPPEQVLANISMLTQQQLDDYPASFVSAFTPQQIELLSPELQLLFAPKIEKGLKVLEELYLTKEKCDISLEDLD